MAGFVLASRPTCLVSDTMIGLVSSDLFPIKRVKIMNNALIPVFTGNMTGVSVQLVDARLLHTFIESKQQFSDWIKSRIRKYEFIQAVDFIVIHNFMKDDTAFGGKRKTIDYHLTLDMAKELSMVENNPKGREARRYFIECEKRLLGQVPDHVAKAYDELVANKIPEYLKVITAPLPVAEFEERYHFHENALESLKNAQVIMLARDFLIIKQLKKA
jgi:phage anti-repressor protein